MLKLIAELAVASLCAYAVKTPVIAILDKEHDVVDMGNIGNVAKVAVDGFVDGTHIGCLALGSAAAFPLMAPIGACMLAKDVYTHREVIVTGVTDAASYVADKSVAAYDEVMSWFISTPVVTEQLAAPVTNV